MKKLVREHTDVCNVAKKQIDNCKVELDKKADERKQNIHAHMAAVEDEELFNDDDGGPQDIIDEEELSLLQSMKAVKKQYRSTYNELKDARGKASQIQQSIDMAKQAMVAEFETWYDQTYEQA